MGVSISDDFGDRLMPSPAEPMKVARVLLDDYRQDDTLTLRAWRGAWMRWQRSHWAEAEVAEVAATVYRRLEHSKYLDGKDSRRAWGPNRRKVGDVLDALRALTHLPESVDSPSWLSRSARSAIRPIVACTNGLLDVSTRELLDLTPTYFNETAVPFAFDAEAGTPTRWLAFLDELWGDDRDSIAALQEWFGYVLSGRTDLQKILLLVGPTRSGKGTIARVLSALVGKGNAVGPTLASMATNFGLSPLIGKPLAVVSDARLGGANAHQVVERLLSISGEDMIDIDRKYRDPWSGKLSTRLMILSNELPRFGDASGAIANRFVVLTMNASFLGHEDSMLTRHLLDELPGILLWALDGLDRISVAPFTVPASSSDATRALADLVSPVAAFVRDECEKGPFECPVDETYARWREWCDDNGHKPTSTQTFGRDLRAVIPGLRTARPRTDNGRERRFEGIRLSPAANNGEASGPSGPSGPEPPESAENHGLVRVVRDPDQCGVESQDSADNSYSQPPRAGAGPSGCRACGHVPTDRAGLGAGGCCVRCELAGATA